jgi:hypothetical protein
MPLKLYRNQSTQVDITGYVAVDKNADLILLKVTGVLKHATLSF